MTANVAGKRNLADERGLGDHLDVLLWSTGCSDLAAEKAVEWFGAWLTKRPTVKALADALDDWENLPPIIRPGLALFLADYLSDRLDDEQP